MIDSPCKFNRKIYYLLEGKGKWEFVLNESGLPNKDKIRLTLLNPIL
jgi:hypothetical protein